MQLFLSSMEKVKISSQPYFHSGDSILSWWKDLILAALPVVFYKIIRNSYVAIWFILSLFVIIIFKTIISMIMKKELNWKEDIIHGFVLSLFYILPVDNNISWIMLALGICTGVIVNELFFNSSGRSVFPAFLIGWLILGREAILNQELILSFAAILGGIYLLLKRRLSLNLLIGGTVFFGFWILFNNDFNLSIFNKLSIIFFIVFGYPGLIPYGKIARVVFGVLSCFLIIKFGVGGLGIASLLTVLMTDL
ncbi:MAG: RnfABCDGE type electron transport complex subunit D [Elusimicrobiota bacterium]